MRDRLSHLPECTYSPDTPSRLVRRRRLRHGSTTSNTWNCEVCRDLIARQFSVRSRTTFNSGRALDQPTRPTKPASCGDPPDPLTYCTRKTPCKRASATTSIADNVTPEGRVTLRRRQAAFNGGRLSGQYQFRTHPDPFYPCHAYTPKRARQ